MADCAIVQARMVAEIVEAVSNPYELFCLQDRCFLFIYFTIKRVTFLCLQNEFACVMKLNWLDHIKERRALAYGRREWFRSHDKFAYV